MSDDKDEIFYVISNPKHDEPKLLFHGTKEECEDEVKKYNSLVRAKMIGWFELPPSEAETVFMDYYLILSPKGCKQINN